MFYQATGYRIKPFRVMVVRVSGFVVWVIVAVGEVERERRRRRRRHVRRREIASSRFFGEALEAADAAAMGRDMVSSRIRLSCAARYKGVPGDRGGGEGPERREGRRREGDTRRRAVRMDGSHGGRHRQVGLACTEHSPSPSVQGRFPLPIVCLSSVPLLLVAVRTDGSSPQWSNSSRASFVIWHFADNSRHSL